jgi:hypothetical protein
MRVRDTGRCVCGARLEPAWNWEGCFEFNNCFECFPNFARVRRGEVTG